MKTVTEIRCSGLSRPMTCAGSLFFENLPEQEDSGPAKEGTAAGRLLQHFLEDTEPGTHCENGVPFDDDMRFYTTDVAKDIHAKSGVSEILCEKRIDWQTRSGIWIRGQYDVSYVGQDSKLYIDDLKYGWKIVDPKENWQLLGYAIGEVIRRNYPFEKIVMRIHQPRPHHEDGPIRSWEISYEQLLEYKEKIELRMDQIAAGLKELVTSEKCKYCPAAASACTAFNRAFYHGVDYVLGDFKQDSLNDKEISFQLDLMGRINELMKIKKESIEQLAVSRIKSGAIIPGYMTEESYGDRKWKPGISPKVIEVLTGKNIVKQEMLSPAQAEKVGVPKDLVKTYVDRHFLGLKLAKKDANKLGDQIFGKKE
jgi:hypothetical protein